ncbi:hypothetical protein LR48_Vigan10g280300 [Vigna angularis]|uniref:Uncharacterized protein n=1 Tax=Phaseolus angularis TaxID=3914 RepID=A0A0L9VPC0_PHAAN|nr:hypothetical protein LR48_Vigan10g280300 [Vigna angularis]
MTVGMLMLAVHPDVSTNLGWQLMRVFQLLHHPGARTPVATQISYSPDSQSSDTFCVMHMLNFSEGDALLEEALEKEVLEDANLVEVEVKAEQ